ncbi:hypothetical protein [Thermococcus sp.]|uniref:hypothetical protein n=1 Tax=Thermococcus sp. TaxID=35749 RepID=UPI0026136EC8|nr:hypothetical protein [Thermococcus sp.]
MKPKTGGNGKLVRGMLLAVLLAILAFFEMLYFFGSLDGTCYAFCITFYNLPCLVFSVGMFIFGLASVIAWFPRHGKLLMASLSLYFSVTLLASLCWVRWVPALSFAGLALSLIAFRLSGGSAIQSRDVAERFFFGLAFSVFLVLLIDDVIRCVDFTLESTICALLLLGLLSVPLRIKRPRYSPIPLLLYFILRPAISNSRIVEGFALVGVMVSVLALAFAFGTRISVVGVEL